MGVWSLNNHNNNDNNETTSTKWQEISLHLSIHLTVALINNPITLAHHIIVMTFCRVIKHPANCPFSQPKRTRSQTWLSCFPLHFNPAFHFAFCSLFSEQLLLIMPPPPSPPNVFLHFITHHMLGVNDAEFTWLDKQWKAREIWVRRCCW